MTSTTTSVAPSMLNKVPEVTVIFWVIKIMATTVGETGADFLASHIDPVVAYGVIGTAFVATLFAQLQARRYIPWLYWLAVVLVSVVGTLLTDALTDGLAISLFLSTTVFAAALSATFLAWNARERTLSIHSITTPSRERFYWAAILFTFALGTAAGDLMAEQLQLGYALSAAVFAGMIAVVAFTYYAGKANAVLAFWIAYVLTRPLGASFGDLLSQPPPDGGMGLGTIGASAVFLTVIVALVTVLTIGDVRRAAAQSPAEF